MTLELRYFGMFELSSKTMLQNNYFLVKFVCTQKMRKNYAIFMQRVPILHMSAKLVTKIKKVG